MGLLESAGGIASGHQIAVYLRLVDDFVNPMEKAERALNKLEKSTGNLEQANKKASGATAALSGITLGEGVALGATAAAVTYVIDKLLEGVNASKAYSEATSGLGDKIVDLGKDLGDWLGPIINDEKGVFIDLANRADALGMSLSGLGGTYQENYDQLNQFSQLEEDAAYKTEQLNQSIKDQSDEAKKSMSEIDNLNNSLKGMLGLRSVGEIENDKASIPLKKSQLEIDAKILDIKSRGAGADDGSIASLEKQKEVLQTQIDKLDNKNQLAQTDNELAKLNLEEHTRIYGQLGKEIDSYGGITKASDVYLANLDLEKYKLDQITTSLLTNNGIIVANANAEQYASSNSAAPSVKATTANQSQTLSPAQKNILPTNLAPVTVNVQGSIIKQGDLIQEMVNAMQRNLTGYVKY